MKEDRSRAAGAGRSAGCSRTAGLDAAWRQERGEDSELRWGMRRQVAQVGAVVRELPERQRAAFILRDVLGYETDEIAEIIGCAGDNVRQLLSRARKRIRKYLLENE